MLECNKIYVFLFGFRHENLYLHMKKHKKRYDFLDFLHTKKKKAHKKKK